MKLLSLKMPKELKIDMLEEKHGRFLLAPLERGFGITIANSLRRILLSSIQGAAIISVKAEGVFQEFSVLPGVREDMTEIILNLKKVRVQIRDGKQKQLHLHVKKPGQITAGIIKTTEGIIVSNPDQHIATITEKGGEIKFDMVADIGKGFVPAETFKTTNAPIGTVFLDAIFSPVTKVNYKIETTRVGQKTDYEKLSIDVWTDGTIKPDEAIALSAKILRDHINLLIQFEEEPEIIETEEVDKELQEIRRKLNIEVSELELSVRSNNVMKQAHIKTLGDLVKKSEAEMLKYRNFGKKSLAEMNKILKSYDINFGMDISKYIKHVAVEEEDSEHLLTKKGKEEKPKKKNKKK